MCAPHKRCQFSKANLVFLVGPCNADCSVVKHGPSAQRLISVSHFESLGADSFLQEGLWPEYPKDVCSSFACQCPQRWLLPHCLLLRRNPLRWKATFSTPPAHLPKILTSRSAGNAPFLAPKMAPS